MQSVPAESVMLWLHPAGCEYPEQFFRFHGFRTHEADTPDYPRFVHRPSVIPCLVY